MIKLLTIPRYIAMAITFLLAIQVLQTAVRIELLNAQAGYYLPRGHDGDGKWRVSLWPSPRNELRGLVGSAGLLQYVLAPILMIASLQLLLRAPRLPFCIPAIFGICIGAAGLMLAIYREYYPSLGW